MKPPRVSVIVVNWNGETLLGPCLESLRQQRYHDFEVLVVDNGSTDGSKAFVRQYFPEVRFIELTANRGFAGGCNVGLRATQGELIATLNNDATAEPEWLGELVKAMDSQEEMGACASKMLLMHRPEIIDSAGITLDRAGIALDRREGERDGGDEEPCEVFGVCSGAALYRRSMLEEVGLFDEDFGSYWEDVDLSWRAQLRGWRCLYVPTARVLHHHSATLGLMDASTSGEVRRGKGSALKDRLLGKNKLATLLKNYPAPECFLYLPLILFYDALSVGYHLLVHGNPAPLWGRLAALAALPRTLRKRGTIQANRTNAGKHWQRALSSLLSPRAYLRRYRQRQALLARQHRA